MFTTSRIVRMESAVWLAALLGAALRGVARMSVAGTVCAGIFLLGVFGGIGWLASGNL